MEEQKIEKKQEEIPKVVEDVKEEVVAAAAAEGKEEAKKPINEEEAKKVEEEAETEEKAPPSGVHSFIQVIDLQNSPGLLKGAQAMKKFVSLLQDNYPELAAKQIVLNMPWWYYPALYRVFKMEPKVVWAGPGKSTETLFK
ncbi:hypothetical protein GOP47_0001688 [Adiantum capillus-veneris]|uniref:CRAL-TRIO domain-containing protein n=1 Tax=Adiantum capillus-veneris TaxID=13818 RepID=A0A9D4V8Q7_ADICA|nr:hypothetical protein GOP47_0001688 [Adiantum capillus-veneris]